MTESVLLGEPTPFGLSLIIQLNSKYQHTFTYLFCLVFYNKNTFSLIKYIFRLCQLP